MWEECVYVGRSVCMWGGVCACGRSVCMWEECVYVGRSVHVGGVCACGEECVHVYVWNIQ